MEINKQLKRGMVMLLDNHRNLSQHLKCPYRIEEYGCTKVSINKYGEKKYYNITTGKLKGAHLSRCLRLDLEKRLESGEYKYFNINPLRRNVRTVFFNKKACNKNAGEMLYGIDINSCYWQTAYNIGLISKHVYDLGYKNKEYKAARNTAIGSLGRIKRIEVFDGINDPVITYEHCETNRARLDVIDYVFNMAVDISLRLGDDFCFYLTDCFFVTESGRDKVRQLVKEYNYTVKEDINKLIGIETINSVETIRWQRFDQQGKNGIGMHMFSQDLDIKSIAKSMGLKSWKNGVIKIV